MKLSLRAAGALALVSLAGCSTPPSIWELKYGPDKPQFSYVRQSTGEKTGDLYIWNPNTTASFTSQNGTTCIQSAGVFRVGSAAASGKIAADAAGSSVTGLDVGYSAQSAQAAILLASQDAKATFLSVALFNLCMMSMNGQIQGTDAAAAFSNALEKAANLQSPTFPPVTVITSGPLVAPPATPASSAK